MFHGKQTLGGKCLQCCVHSRDRDEEPQSHKQCDWTPAVCPPPLGHQVTGAHALRMRPVVGDATKSGGEAEASLLLIHSFSWTGGPTVCKEVAATCPAPSVLSSPLLPSSLSSFQPLGGRPAFPTQIPEPPPQPSDHRSPFSEGLCIFVCMSCPSQ